MIYNDQKPYIFISYAHRDSHTVLGIINDLIAAGYNVWWDEGIDPGTEWDENIALHVKGCGYFVAFMSKNYIASKNCKDELNYSRDLDKDQLLVYLEDVELPDGMAMRMNRIQSIFWGKYPDRKDAFEKLCSAKGIEITKLSNEAPAGWKPAVVPAAPVQTGASGGKNKLPFIIGIAAAVLVVIVAAVAVLSGVNKGADQRYEARSSADEDDEEEESSGKKSRDEDKEEASEEKDDVVTEDQEAVDDVDKDAGDNAPAEVTGEGKGGDIRNYISMGFLQEEDALKLSCFGTGITRGEITSISFLSSLPEREDKGLDISADADGSVLAWFDEVSGGGYELTIAADGKIRLPEDCSFLFMGYGNARSIDFNDAVDAGKVKSVRHMFSYDKSLRSFDVSAFADAELTNMAAWFFHTEALTRIDGLDKLDTSKVTSFNTTFYYCTNLKEIDVSGFDTSSAEDMLAMFMYCSVVEKLDVSGFDTSNVTGFTQMFAGCNELKSLDVSGFDTSKGERFKWMFAGAWSLDEVDLSGWSFANVAGDEAVECLFEKMKSGVKIRIKEEDLAILKSYESAFKDAPEDIEFITE
ncbi:MAG: BspA family leucine-rich repeat surface protein [Lachnospiraceae bacterium]|nr:BspA family leucine-rich repeat surface protein [Lachnospiraceae bacterium]